ncbi:MAG: hypothetical protein QW102_04230, partial [Candidatus Nezhaarchaeales archaeon]
MKPVMNIVGVRARGLSVREFSKKMRKLGWLLSEFPTHLRVVLMPHHTEDLINELLRDLKIAATKKLVKPKATLKI